MSHRKRLNKKTRIECRSEKLVKRNVDADSDIEYATSRYACDLKGILQQSQTGSLSFDDYPSIYPMPDDNRSATITASGITSIRKETSRYASGSRRSSTASVKTRMIVFVAGGACYSELRAAQEIMNKGGQEIILGSTHFTNPTTFIDDLKTL